MRTSILLLTTACLFTAPSLRETRAEVVPTNADQVAVGVLVGSKITNYIALSTNAAVSNVVTAPFRLAIPRYEGMEKLEVLVSTDLNGPWVTNASSATTNVPAPNSLVGYDWTNGLPGTAQFQRIAVTPIDSNKLLTAIAFNRLAYGATPYELAEILGVNADGIIGGPGATGATKTIQQWIDEQLNPASIAEDVTNQFGELAALGARFTGYTDIILSNTVITNFYTNVTFNGTNFVTNITSTNFNNTETNGPGTLSFHNFRAWYAMHCVGARRQLLEVMLYWLENHHVSQWTKTRDTFSGAYNGQNSDIANRIPTAMESREHMAFRAAMLNPAVTWRDLMHIQHQSESMTVYLDTNDSLGNGSNIANENYGREILELFCMGVDNGYDQRDITAVSVAWTGWDVQKVSSYGNLYQHQTAALSGSLQTNTGVYALQYRSSRHCNSNIYAFYHTTNGIAGTRGNSYNNNYPNGPVIPGTAGFKMVPARFNGAGMTPSFDYTLKLYGTNTVPGSYALFIPRTDATGAFDNNASTNAVRTNKAYTIMNHIADLPFTQEFICVKLCRLLVHDEFPYGETGFDFSDGTVTPEEQLVWDCMMTWENPPGGGPPGQIWKIIKTITDSALFRSQAAQGSKIKNPLEYTMSAVRALRTSTNGSFAAGSFSADTDGYTIVSGNSSTATAHPLNRMGRYLIFDREEPDGYPETGTTYAGAGAITERNRWVSVILDDNESDGISGGARTRIRPTHLLQQFVPLGKQNDPDIVTRFFLSCLFPGEGEANLDFYRRRGIEILDTALNGAYSAGSFRSQAINSSEYNNRVQRLAATLLAMPRFHEQ